MGLGIEKGGEDVALSFFFVLSDFDILSSSLKMIVRIDSLSAP